MTLEGETSKRNKKADLQKIILASVQIAGILAVGMVAPNVIGAMSKLGLMPHQRQKESILSSRRRLVKNGLLKYKDGMLEITDKGKKILDRELVFDKARNKNKKWDGKWRVLIFDIPEKRKGDREYIRNTLIHIGFMRLQDSVWIYPYDCEDLVTLLKADLKIGKEILYMIVESLEHDKPVKNYFGFE